MTRVNRCIPAIAAAGGALLATQRTSAEAERKFTADDVSANDGADGRPLWISFRGGVHDVTEFANEHPGGKFIELAAGGDVEGFWKYWYYHFHSPKVTDALRRTRIGSLVASNEDETAEAEDDPYRTDPVRDMSKHVRWLLKPFNSETVRSVLSASYLTPTDALYVRNHAPVPQLGGESSRHCVEFTDGGAAAPSSMSLADLGARFRRVTVTSVLQCAGNRAADDARSTGPNGFKDTPFEALGCGMVGNVRWSGYRLAELLPAMFPQLASSPTAAIDRLHVIFEGADGYESSTPARAVLREAGDCLLATHMNGEPRVASPCPPALTNLRNPSP